MCSVGRTAVELDAPGATPVVMFRIFAAYTIQYIRASIMNPSQLAK